MKKRIKQIADRYAKIVQWSDEDACYIGRVPALSYGGVHGSDRAAVFSEICQVAEEAVEGGGAWKQSQCRRLSSLAIGVGGCVLRWALVSGPQASSFLAVAMVSMSAGDLSRRMRGKRRARAVVG